MRSDRRGPHINCDAPRGFKQPRPDTYYFSGLKDCNGHTPITRRKGRLQLYKFRSFYGEISQFPIFRQCLE